MTTTLEAAKALVQAGFLPQSAIQVAADMLEESLSKGDAIEARTAALSDEALQEDMIAKASAFAEQDASLGNEKDLKVDQAIIQDAINQEQVDEAVIRNAEHQISAACKKATSSLAAAGLVESYKQDEVASLIEEMLFNEV